MTRTPRLVGRQAPTFRLQDQDGTWVELGDLLADGPVLLVFYPADLSLVCTRQLCEYRDSYADVRARGVQIVGISPDPPNRHQEFIAARRLEFRLLSDRGMEAFRAYGVYSRWIPGSRSRGLFLVARSGEVVYEKVEATAFTYRGVDDVLKALQALEARS